MAMTGAVGAAPVMAVAVLLLGLGLAAFRLRRRWCRV
jgi:hypothetical protein